MSGGVIAAREPAREFLDALTAPFAYAERADTNARVPDGNGGVTMCMVFTVEAEHTMGATNALVEGGLPSTNANAQLLFVSEGAPGGAPTIFTGYSPQSSASFDEINSMRVIASGVSVEPTSPDTDRRGRLVAGLTEWPAVQSTAFPFAANTGVVLGPTALWYGQPKSYPVDDGAMVRWYPNAANGIPPWEWRRMDGTYTHNWYWKGTGATTFGQLKPMIEISGATIGDTYLIRYVLIIEMEPNRNSLLARATSASPGCMNFETLVGLSNDFSMFPLTSTAHSLSPLTSTIMDIFKEAAPGALNALFSAVGGVTYDEVANLLGIPLKIYDAVQKRRKNKKQSKKKKSKPKA